MKTPKQLIFITFVVVTLLPKSLLSQVVSETNWILQDENIKVSYLFSPDNRLEYNVKLFVSWT